MSTFPAILRIATAATCGCLLAACSNSEPTLQETREMALDVRPGSTLVIEAGAGPMTVTGDDGESIRIVAGIYQHTASDDYRLVLEADGDDGARIEADTPSAQFGTSNYIDLDVRVPRSTTVRIEDESGSLRVNDLAGDLVIEDQSGSITIASVGGSITIDDGSGSITIEGVGGDVTIEDDSGSIEVVEVAGTVTVRDGSGSITVRNAGDFELVEDGSGSVNLEGIRSRDDAE